MTCTVPSHLGPPPSLEPGDRVFLYTTPQFPGTWRCDYGTWHLAVHADCENLQYGDLYVVCRLRPEGDGDRPARCGMTMPSRRSRYSILCSNPEVARAAATGRSAPRATARPRPPEPEAVGDRSRGPAPSDARVRGIVISYDVHCWRE